MRLIEIDNVGAASSLALILGDVLYVHASGGRVKSGTAAVEAEGPFVQAVVGEDGSVLTPMGSPNAMLFRAVGAGEAIIEVIAGDPWHSPRAIAISIRVTD